jgi:hypothetical protein
MDAEVLRIFMDWYEMQTPETQSELKAMADAGITCVLPEVLSPDLTSDWVAKIKPELFIHELTGPYAPLESGQYVGSWPWTAINKHPITGNQLWADKLDTAPANKEPS